MINPKFKVGDRVKVLQCNPLDLLKVGNVYTVTSTKWDTFYTYGLDDMCGAKEDWLELVERPGEDKKYVVFCNGVGDIFDTKAGATLDVEEWLSCGFKGDEIEVFELGRQLKVIEHNRCELE